MAFPDGLKFGFLYDAGVELLAPDMGVQFLHRGDRRDLDGAVVKVGDVTGVTIFKNINGAMGQPLIFGVYFIEDDRWFSFRCVLSKELDVLEHLDSLIVSFEIIIPIPVILLIAFFL